MGARPARRPVRAGGLGAGQPRAVDRPRRTRCSCAGRTRYEHLVALCRRLGVLTPEDDYVTWTGPGGPVAVAPLFLLYDYSFRPAGAADRGGGARGRVRGGRGLHRRVPAAPGPVAGPAGLVPRPGGADRGPAGRAAGRAPGPVLVNHFPLTRLPDPGAAAPGVRHLVRHRADRGLAPPLRRGRGRLRAPAHPADHLGGRRPVRGGLDRLPAGVAAARRCAAACCGTCCPTPAPEVEPDSPVWPASRVRR